MKKTILILALLIPYIFFTSCDKEEDEINDNNNTEVDNELTVNIENLAPSAGDEQYEGWILVGGNPVSTGTFTVNSEGELSKTKFIVDPDDLSSATDFILTIEPKPDTDPAPSSIKLLAGTFVDNTAGLSTEHSASLGNDFSNVLGKFILATPTTDDSGDELSGIWFLDLITGSPDVSLQLPDLPDGWKYEGWVVMNGMPVTTGKFTQVDTADELAPYSGSDNLGPLFPGEDFVMNAPSGLTFPTDLSGMTAVISIEPDPDNSPQPFALKPLLGSIPDPADDQLTYDMSSNVVGSFPSGMVSR